MKKERKSILEMIRGLFKRNGIEEGDKVEVPAQETVERLMNRTLGEPMQGDEKSDARQSPENGDAEDGNGSGRKESCPYATKRAIVTSIAEIKRFAEEHKLAASVLKSLLALLVEIAIGALKGKVSRQVLEALLKALTYEMAMEEAFRKGETEGRNEMTEERFPSLDDGLPHLNGTILRGESASIFDVAAAARK